MPHLSLVPKRILVLLLLLLSLTLTACGTLWGDRAFYAFGFDVSYSTPNVSVLDYQYTANGRVIWGISDSRKSAPSFKGVKQTSIGGRLPVGDKLYVKWREEGTGRVREETVDLSKRLPSDMDDKYLSLFIAQGSIHVYVSSLRGFITTECPARHKERDADPTNPDLMARSYFCGKDLQKVYPEQKQMD